MSEIDLTDVDREEFARALDGREPQAVAEAAVELVVGLFAADTAGLWWFREGIGPRLVARTPALAHDPQQPRGWLPFAPPFPADGPRRATADAASAPERAFLDASGLARVFLMPFRVDDLGQWLLTVGWQEAPEDDLLDEATLGRFVVRLETTLLRATERKMREESHLELADNVAQALVVANTLFEMGDPEAAHRAVARALERTKEVMARLQRDDPGRAFVRLYPSSVEVLDPEADS